ncbi:Aromatic ring-cleaving dioxygenase-like protein [Sphingopyxis alaskensis RB2256]|jgi:aromatic ring-cleaving dioxygenase|uniref:Aromatic ring-cleaving dioxygenase-like protein n=2 Tax=Sphingopyxis alaskensis TaxID=117207 RepID=Q1GVI7_SPHAL|nr:Aromatic ring-cleaving dioxygenase-like protein [Sphingopyxis alaskensis RB2256]
MDPKAACMTDPDAPYHAHVYYDPAERSAAAALRDDFGRNSAILFVGAMADGAAGPHPIAQYEVHFLARSRDAVVAAIAATGLRALVHPLTDDDVADHTSLAQWIGEPVDLDLTVLDPPGGNQGIPRFGLSDFQASTGPSAPST